MVADPYSIIGRRNRIKPAPPDILVRGAVPVGVRGGLASGRCDHVDIRIIGHVASHTGPDLEDLCVAVGTLLEAMTVLVSCREPGSIAGMKDLLATIGDKHDLAGKDINEFVFTSVPMALTRPRTRRQPTQVHAELCQPGGVPELGALASAAGHIEGWRVERADHRGQCSNVDPLLHGSAPLVEQSLSLVTYRHDSSCSANTPEDRKASEQYVEQILAIGGGLPILAHRNVGHVLP